MFIENHTQQNAYTAVHRRDNDKKKAVVTFLVGLIEKLKNYLINTENVEELVNEQVDEKIQNIRDDENSDEENKTNHSEFLSKNGKNIFLIVLYTNFMDICKTVTDFI